MKFLKFFFITVVFLLLIIISFNYFVDATGRYFNLNKNNEKVKKLLLSNNKVAVLNQINPFFYKSNLISSTEKKIDIIICGTSKIQNIGSQTFENQSYLNVAGSGMSFYDVLFLCDFAIKKHNPKKIIFSLEPHSFHTVNVSKEWIRLSDEKVFKKLLKIYGVPYNISIKSNFYKEYLFNLLNYNILRNNLKYLDQLKNLNTKKFITDKNLIQELNRKEIFLEIYFKDGVIKNNLQSIYDESSYISYLAENSLKRESVYVQTKEIQLEKFVENHSDNIEIVLVKIPFHPIFYESDKEKFNYNRVEKFAKNISKKYNVQVKGNYNFLLTQCEKREMLDAQHLLESCIKKLLKN
tara:strand:- start:1479 stop:2534 length:1056 start_codon:yes stop_codon:yes gene_type:complete